MNIDILNEKLDNPEVKYDFRGNEVRAGDIVIFTGYNGMEIDIVKKICPSGIKVMSNPFKTYQSYDFCRAEKLLNDQEIEALRSKYMTEKQKQKESSKIVERYVIFCYRNSDGDVGIGSFKINCEDKKTAQLAEIQKSMSKYPNTEFYFLNKKNDIFFINEQKNDVSKDILILSNRSCGFTSFTKTKEVFYKYVSNDPRYEKLINDGKAEYEKERKHYWIHTNYSYFDRDFIFLLDRNESFYNKDTPVFSTYYENSAYISPITFLRYKDNRNISDYEKYDSYIKMIKDFLNKHI